jgi:hypothetical protein
LLKIIYELIILFHFYTGNDEQQEFYNALQVLFTFDAPHCQSDECKEPILIKCAHCGLNLCFEHFIIVNDEHFHFEKDLLPTLLNYKDLGMVTEPRKKKTNDSNEKENENNDEEED